MDSERCGCDVIEKDSLTNVMCLYNFSTRTTSLLPLTSLTIFSTCNGGSLPISNVTSQLSSDSIYNKNFSSKLTFAEVHVILNLEVLSIDEITKNLKVKNYKQL